MSEVVRFEDSAHWYEVDGTPAYTRKSKSGTERNTTLRDARKENLVPSVTTVLRILSNPFLERWKLENLLTAALSLPEIEGESVQDYAERVWEDANTISEGARNFGTNLHDAIERRLRLGTMDGMVCTEDVTEHLAEFDKWAQANVIKVHAVEFTVVGQEGYAGKVDALLEHRVHGLCYTDWKSQNIRPGKKPTFYDSWPRQLAAYRHAHNPDGALLSVVMDKNEASPPIEKLWTQAEAEIGLKTFLQTLELWQTLKNYKPLMPDS